MSYKAYKGSMLVKKIYHGSTAIKKVYKGSTLVWQADFYEPGTVLYESSIGGATAALSLEDVIYEVYCIGGGAGSSGRYFGSTIRGTGGGSGAGFIGQVKLSKSTYPVSVAAGGSANGGHGGNSAIGNAIIAYGASGMTGGEAPDISVDIISTTLNSPGNSGSSGTGSKGSRAGASLYNGYGAGAGLANGGAAGGAGYVKITYVGL